MTEHLKHAIREADNLAERLRDTYEADDDLEVTEDEIEKRTNNIMSSVRRHNDELAETTIDTEMHDDGHLVIRGMGCNRSIAPDELEELLTTDGPVEIR